MPNDANKPPSRPPRGSRREDRESARSAEQAGRTFVRRGLTRARREEYQKLYRNEYIARHGGGEKGKEALRRRDRQHQRESRGIRYLPLLFETEDRRYRLWTWRGPSKLILKTLEEARGMEHLFFPARLPVLVPYEDQLDRHLWSAFKSAAAGLPIQTLSRSELVAYAFRLWNDCRGYEYFCDLDADEDPFAADSSFRLVSYLLVDAVTEPLQFIRYLTSRILPGLNELVEELETNDCPFDPSDPLGRCIYGFRRALTAAQSWLVESGLEKTIQAAPENHRAWFRRQIRLAERTYPRLQQERPETPLPRTEPSILPAPLDPSVATQGEASGSAYPSSESCQVQEVQRPKRHQGGPKPKKRKARGRRS